jgi:UDP-GlcNAc:undecaprenyl-phosphate/decaprenyl-phosphate GlcNAc-1-phosphate transferase
VELGGWGYVGVFAATLLLTWVLTPVALRVALRRGILDHPGAIKAQATAVPYLGGLAIVLAFSIAIMGGAVLSRPAGGLGELAVILGLGVVLSGVGLIDDVKGLGPGIRLLAETLAAILVVAAGIEAVLFNNPVLDGFITVLWIVGVMNAFNILDNMDGLSAGIAAISASIFFVIAAVNGQFLVAALSLGVVGCSLGFLKHNFHPAKIYMGDAGSLYLGFLLAILGLKLRFNAPVQITFLVPIMVLGVPIFDMILVVTNRLLNGRNPWSGGRDHTSHRLIFVGLPVPVAVGLVYLGQVGLGWLAVVLSRLDLTTGYILMTFVLTFGMLFGVLLSLVPVYEESKRRRLMIQEVKTHEVEPEVRAAPDAPRVGSAPATPERMDRRPVDRTSEVLEQQ